MKKSFMVILLGMGTIFITFESSRGLSGYDVTGNFNKIFVQEQENVTLKTVYTCPMHPEVVQEKSGKCAKCGMDLVAKKEVKKDVYACPMHSEVVQDKSGKCAKCGMDLVAKKEVKKDVYSCPMHSEVVQDKLGKCPKCGMNLSLNSPEKKSEPTKN